MAKTIVVLGANFTGLPVAHYLLKHTAAKVKGGIKVVVVSPNTDMYWFVAAPRGMLPGKLPDEKLFYPIAPTFKKYPSDTYELIVGKAQNIDPTTNTVTVQKNDGGNESIRYDYL